MFYMILLGLVGATAVVFLQDAKPAGPKQERLANVMKRIAGKNQKDQFVCTQLDDRYAHYVYELDSNILSILAGPDYITINAQKAKTKQPLLDVRYDTRSRVYTEKKISEQLLKKESDLEKIDLFLRWAIMSFQPEKMKMIYQNNNNFTALINELEDARKRNYLSSPIDHAFTQIIPSLGYLLEHVDLISDVDYEHQVKETIIKDLRKLIADFSQLESKQQEKYEHDTLNRLIIIQERITQIRRHIDNTREFDLKKTLTTIDQRYEK
ncbi:MULTISPECIES: hypothetical protein [unclassified Bacillus (in: firmicutes)]|uniref:hypothetical protein n=1 Tax=unclassified Bacillus (in: firmicutes) TaxID=185979 RepID=UPI00080AD83C|nr:MULTISPECIES: hypothetical protein [unclassified Bacillus (in: firmicutes)]OCA86963.1 hypothetical protein A8L44_06820 [Bacillus sp. FJAT-27986]